MFDKIARHIGHSIEVASYTYNEYQYSGNLNYKPDDTEEIVNVAVECIDCNEVIADVDNENHADEFDSELSVAEDDWEFESKTWDSHQLARINGWKFDLIKGD